MRSATQGGPAGIGPAGTAIELQRRFRASPDRVFRAWTAPTALREWWCPPGWIAGDIEIDLRPGGSYRIEMSRLCDSALVAIRGAFLEVTPPGGSSTPGAGTAPSRKWRRPWSRSRSTGRRTGRS